MGGMYSTQGAVETVVSVLVRYFQRKKLYGRFRYSGEDNIKIDV
jgi:hypothetical protein